MPISKEKVKEGSAAVLQEATPVGGGYVGFFSLQAGTVLTSTCIFSVALITFFYNLSAPNDSYERNEYVTQYALVYSYVSLTFIGTGIVSTFAFKKNPKWLLVGSIFVTCSSAYWFILSLLSFFPSLRLFKYLCIMDRCPPTHWIFEVPWRNSIERNQSADGRMDDRDHTSNTYYTTNGTSSSRAENNTNATTSHSPTSQPSTLAIDLDKGATHPPNATGTIADNCDQPATISNEFLFNELHDLKVIEKMKKMQPSEVKDDEDDVDTQQDNALYDAVKEESKGNEPVSHSTVEPPQGTSEAEVVTNTSSAADSERSPGVRAISRANVSAEMTLTSQHSTVSVSVNNNNRNEYPEVREVPEELQKWRDEQWKVKTFMSSLEIMYSSDMYGGNLAMSLISFLVFSAFLVYGLVCMFYLHKRLKRRQSEREMEENDEAEVTYVSRMSLRTHPSKKSQQSQ